MLTDISFMLDIDDELKIEMLIQHNTQLMEHIALYQATLIQLENRITFLTRNELIAQEIINEVDNVKRYSEDTHTSFNTIETLIEVIKSLITYKTLPKNYRINYEGFEYDAVNGLVPIGTTQNKPRE